MSGLPRGWVETSLAEISRDISYGFTTKSSAVGDGARLLRITDIQDYKVDWGSLPFCDDQPDTNFLVRSGDIVVARTGATTGKSFLIKNVPAPTAFASYLIRIAVSHEMQSEYVWKFMQGPDYWQQIQVVPKGTAQPGANAIILGQVRIPVSPLAEQKHIVAKLDALNAKSARARTELARIESLVSRYKAAVLTSLISEETRDAPSHILGDLTLKIGSGATPRGGRSVYLEDGTAFIRSQNVHFEGFRWEGLTYIDEIAANALASVETAEDDVLLSITGASIGRVCLVPKVLVGARVNQHVAIVRCRKDRLTPAFLQLFLWTPAIQSWIWSENYGVTRQALTKGMIEQIAVPVPSLREQKKIVHRIKSAFAKIDLLATKARRGLELVGKLDEAILAKAFRGELVQQDENDEPAEHLLARIRATESASPKGQKRAVKRKSTMLMARDFLNAKLKEWPEGGINFQDLRGEFNGSYGDLKDAVFTLLAEEKPVLQQIFDEDQKMITLRKCQQ